MGGMVAVQTQCCMMKREEDDDEDDVSHSERTEEDTKEKMVVGALPWNMRSGSHLHGAPPCGSAPQVPRSISEATTVVPTQRRV